jgi:hypothetical protein
VYIHSFWTEEKADCVLYISNRSREEVKVYVTDDCRNAAVKVEEVEYLDNADISVAFTFDRRKARGTCWYAAPLRHSSYR